MRSVPTFSQVSAQKRGANLGHPPPALRDQLFERLRDRKITAENLYQLKLWRESEPDAPEGPWYKDFGSFKICGEGEYPKTFLVRGQPAKGAKL
jgi:hypothetical protein